MWLTILVLVVNSPGLLRDVRNLRSKKPGFDPDSFVGLASRKPWIAWTMGIYAIAATVFLVLALTRRIDVSDIGVLQLTLMLAPLVIPATVIHYENLRDD